MFTVAIVTKWNQPKCPTDQWIKKICYIQKLLMITLYAEQKKKKRHIFIEQSFRLCGRRQGWDVSREQHQNMYNI